MKIVNLCNFRGVNYKKEVLVDASIKKTVRASEYDIPLQNDIREEVEEMCNLSQGIKEKAFEEGHESGKEQKLIRVVNRMYKAQFPIEQIADIAEISVDKVKEIINN